MCWRFRRSITITGLTLSENSVLISGHPKYCPEPVLVAIAGSTWGGSVLKRGFVGRGMHLEFSHPSYRAPITTSRIKEIREGPKTLRRGTVAPPIVSWRRYARSRTLKEELIT